MASFRRFRAFPLTAIRTAATAFLQLTSSSRSRGAQIAFTLVDFGRAVNYRDDKRRGLDVSVIPVTLL
jgi:hypothetical protein